LTLNEQNEGGYLDLESRLRGDHFVFPASYKLQDASLTKTNQQNKPTKQTNKQKTNKQKKHLHSIKWS